MESAPVAEVLTALAGIVALVYLGGPVLVRYGMKQPAEPMLQPVPADALRDLPEDVAAFFEQAGNAMVGLGFLPVVHAMLPAEGKNPHVIASMFVHPAANDAAMATVMQPHKQAAELRQAYVEFSTVCEGGVEVDTSNATALDSFRYAPEEKLVLRFPEIQVVAELYRIHKAAVERHGGSRSKQPVPTDVSLLDQVHASMRRDCERQVAAGYLYLDAVRRVFRPTWKGAYLMGWGQLWPVTAIRRVLRAWGNRRLLAQLGGFGVE